VGNTALATAEQECGADSVGMTWKALAVKNVGATWLNLLVHALVGFFLSPFILHRLGDERFSIWVLVFSLTGYYGLLDLGIRTSIVRYVAKFTAIGDEAQLATFLSTSLFFYSVVAFCVLILTGVGALDLQRFFKIPPAQLRSAQVLFLLVGAGVAFSFPLSVFSGLLEGLQRFSWVQLSQLGITLLRGLLIVLALRRGGELLALGAITVAMNLLGYLIFMSLVLWKTPVRLSVRQFDRKALWKMTAYGAFAFVIVVAEKLRFQSDAIVIGAFLSAGAITSFSIGSRLVEYSTYAVRSLAQIFTPMSSQLHATGDLDNLRRILVVGNRACALVIFPICVILIILGKSIIEVWVGSRYVSSYSVLALLIVPKSIYLAQSTSTRILLGMGRHRTLAFVLLLEGVANVILSVLLLLPFGVIGVALGTAIPLSFTSLYFLPRHVCRHLNIALGSFLSRSYLIPIAVCVPLATVLLIMGNQAPAHSYAALLMQVGCGAVVYGAALSLAAFAGRPMRVRTWKSLAQALDEKW
jgi:O-antigen/teichoic acid export membrane protein